MRSGTGPWLLVMGIAVCAAIPKPGTGASAYPQRFRANVAAVRIMIIPRDSSGMLVSDLRGEELSVLVDETEREVLSFEHLTPRNTGEPATSAVGEEPQKMIRPGPGNAVAREPSGRKFLLYFDLHSRGPDPHEKRAAAEAALELLDLLDDRDDVAVATSTYFQLDWVVRWGQGLEAVRRGLAELHRLGPPVPIQQAAKRWGFGFVGARLRGAVYALSGTEGPIHMLFFTLGDGLGDGSDRSALVGAIEYLEEAVRQLQSHGASVHTLNPEATPRPMAINDPRRATSAYQPEGAAGDEEANRRTGSDRRGPRRIALFESGDTMAIIPPFPMTLQEIAGSALDNRTSIYYVAGKTGGITAFARHAIPDAIRQIAREAGNYYVAVVGINPGDTGAPIEVRARGREVRLSWSPARVPPPATSPSTR